MQNEPAVQHVRAIFCIIELSEKPITVIDF